MDNELMSIVFNSKIKPIKPINKLFTLCKCFIMALGKNGNGTIFTKEAVDDALPSLLNIPVVGHLYIDDEDNQAMGGHDVVVERLNGGGYGIKSVTVPFGTVPQDCNAHYEEVEESDGTKKTYLVANIILWTGRYPELLEAKYNDELYFAQSMEVIPFEQKKTSEGFDVKKFQFSALCLLGKSDDKTKNIEPCFKSARVEPYKFSDCENMAELFAEFKEQLAQSYSMNFVEKGGKDKMDKETIRKILSEFGLTEDAELPFEITDDMTEEDLRAKLEEHACKPKDDDDKKKKYEDASEGESVSQELEQNEVFEAEPSSAIEQVVEPQKYAIDLTYEEKRDAIYEVLAKHCVHNADMYKFYYLMDFDDSYVYASYRISGVNMPEEYGTIRIPYIIADCVVSIDMAKAESVRKVWLTKEDEEKITADKNQLTELIQYKQARLEDDKRQSYSEIISQFSDLGEIDEYKLVVKDAMTFESVDALAEKLYAIRGRYADTIVKKPLDQIKIPVGYTAKSIMNEVDEFMARYLPTSQK